MKLGLLFATAFAVGTMTLAANARDARPVETSPVAEDKAQLDEQAENEAGAQDEEQADAEAEAEEKKVASRNSTRFHFGQSGTTGTTGNGIDTTTTGSTSTEETSDTVDVGYGEIVSRYAAEQGVPEALAHAVIRTESNYRPDAVGLAGEIGLMQIKPATARGIGYTGAAQGLHDPDTNIRWGMKYLGMAHELGGGDTCGTLLRYNAGHAATRMNSISANYCAKVKQHLGAS